MVRMSLNNYPIQDKRHLIKNRIRNILLKNNYLLTQIVFWAFAIRNIHIPGLYFDEAGYDYMAARAVNPQINNPIWMFPNIGFPFLGSLYTGDLIVYSDYFIFQILGINIFTVRIAHLLYGAISVFLLQKIIYQSTKRNSIAIGFAALFATDVSFLACYRNQFHVGLIGLPLLLGAILVVGRKSTSRRIYIYSGVLFGLSTYAYFNYFLFLPIILILLMANNGIKIKYFKKLTLLGLGTIIGLIPYFLGIYSLFKAQGGIQQGIDWIKWALGIYQPLASELNSITALKNGSTTVLQSFNNYGNEVQIFGYQLPTHFFDNQFMVIVTYLSIVTTILFFHRMRTRKEIPFTKSDTALALTIPIYAFIGSLIFGEKLTNHHYIVLLPFLPLLFALLSSKLLLIDSKEKFKTKYVVYIFIAIMLTLNVLRFNQFDKHLMLTGGLNKSTYHLNVLSQEALYTGEEVMYFFPDWGFWTSFQTLTGNSIPYEIDTNRETIFKHLSNGKKLRIFVWEKQRILEFEQLVKEVKSNAIISIRERLNYDKSVAFYELSVV
jgi:hypothetical protein